MIHEHSCAISDKPRFAILLATYNGGRWLQEQLDTIFAQTSCDVHIFVNDDGSTDTTLEILNAHPKARKIVTTLHRKGGAGQNFLYLMRETDLNGFDYVAFADQDDLWVCDKLFRAHQQLIQKSADAYSSNVTAFWNDGERRLIIKSQPQRRFDFMFESAGPGCTFVFTYATATSLQQFLRSIPENEIAKVDLHDWLIYAWGRASGRRWVIDDFSSLDYRQHENNVLGASRNKTALKKRWKMVTEGWYLTQAKLIANLVGCDNVPARFLRDGGLGNLLVSLCCLGQLRRRKSESLFVGVVFLHNFFFGAKTNRV